MIHAKNILLGLCGIALLAFIFGPGVVGAFDLACYFMTNAQCTSIAWIDWRVYWAISPWFVGLFVLLVGGAV